MTEGLAIKAEIFSAGLSALLTLVIWLAAWPGFMGLMMLQLPMCGLVAATGC